jgi:hypothetical protein
VCSGWRGGALQKRTPPGSCALADVVLWRSARRRAVVPWLAWWGSVEAHAAVLLCSGWRGGALQKRTPRDYCDLTGVPLCRSARRRAVALWLALWPLSRVARRLAKAVFLIHRKGGWRGLACARGGLAASQGRPASPVSNGARREKLATTPAKGGGGAGFPPGWV